MKRFHQYLINISNIHKKRSQTSFVELGLTPGQPKIIDALGKIDGCAQKDLAAFCELEPATVTNILSHMEKKDYIVRTPEVTEGGKRIMTVHLTKKGHSVQNQVIDICNDMENICFQNFTVEEKEQCLSYLDRIYCNIKR